MDPLISLLLLAGAGLCLWFARTGGRIDVAWLIDQLSALDLAGLSQRMARALQALRDDQPADRAAPDHQLDQPALVELPLISADGQKVGARGWLGALNDRPDTIPHVLVIGPTGAGKTTFVTALLSQRAGQIVVLTPKPDDLWGGLTSITIDDDCSYTSISQAFDDLLSELRRRLVAAKHRRPLDQQLTIVIDDAPALISEAGKSAVAVIKTIARLGRSLRVRLVVLSQSDRVRSLALDGEGDALDNFARVELTTSRQATAIAEGVTLPLDVSHVPLLAGRARLAGRAWVPVSLALPVFSDDELLVSLIPVSMPVPADTDGLIPADTSASDDTTDTAERIRRWSSAGWSRNKIAAELGGNRNTTMAYIRQVLDQQN